MKIAFVGKGGSGKTTLASLFARHLAADGLPVLAIDADVNQHLGVTLGLDEAEAARLPAMGDHLEAIKDYLRGDNPRIRRTFLVVEPTRKSVAVWRQYQGYARGFDVNLSAVGNKVQAGADVAFLRDEVGAGLLVCVEHSGFVRAAEQGRPLALDALEAANRTALERLREAVDATPKDWAKFSRQAVDFHLRNATAWANARTGEDLATQIDPGFTLGPDAPRLATTP